MQEVKEAIAVTEYTLQELKNHGCGRLITERENRNMIRRVETPDDTYVVLYWDWECPCNEDDWTAMLKFLEHRRHARIEITDEGDIFKDVETDDEFGCDEIFEEILGWKTEICLWQNANDVLI